MSKFLDELKDFISDCSMEEKLPHRWVDNHEMVGSAIDMIDSLGENARRMLEIGVMQDELVKLGFKPNSSNPAKWDNFVAFASNTATVKRINIFFGLELVNVSNRTYGYNSPTLREDVINKVTQLISGDN